MAENKLVASKTAAMSCERNNNRGGAKRRRDKLDVIFGLSWPFNINLISGEQIIMGMMRGENLLFRN